jgi:hypothetical protein
MLPETLNSRLQTIATFALVTALIAGGASPAQDVFSIPPRPPDSASALEDWSSLSVEPSRLKPSPPSAIQLDQEPYFLRELVQVEWRPNDPIYLYVIRPKGPNKKYPTILYLYDISSDIDRFRDDEFCKLLVKNDFAAVGFVAALTGHRYHDRGVREWFVSELPYSLVSSVHDVQMILNYLKTRGDIDIDRIGMFGEGAGGTIAILASAVDARLKAIDLFAPWGDWLHWLAASRVVPNDERPDYTNPEFVQRVLPFDPIDWLPRVKARSIRLQYMVDQWGTPTIAQERIKSAAPSRAQIITYPDRKTVSQATASLFDWLKDHVAPPAPDVRPAAVSQQIPNTRR